MKTNSDKKGLMTVNDIGRRFFVSDSLNNFCFMESYPSPKYAQIKTSRFFDKFIRCNFTKDNDHFTFIDSGDQSCFNVTDIVYDPVNQTVSKKNSSNTISYRQVSREEFFNLFRASTKGLYFDASHRQSLDSFPYIGLYVLKIQLDSLPDKVRKTADDEILDLGDNRYVFPQYFWDIKVSYTGELLSQAFVEKKIDKELLQYLTDLILHRKYKTAILLDNEPVNTAYRIRVEITSDK